MIHHDVLHNYQLAEDISISTLKSRCEDLLEDCDYVDENYLRTKRDEQKNDIHLPPGYSIYRIPKLPDKSPMPVFLSLNISKILDWNEFNEVTTPKC